MHIRHMIHCSITHVQQVLVQVSKGGEFKAWKGNVNSELIIMTQAWVKEKI